MRQYRSNQGRSPKQRETNNKMAFFSVIGLLLTIFLIFLTKK
jgi:ACR3 family arsenite efflux pump ArsB|tara:strand:- start:290 stop:415 length:126 start_codon:yes stop_codon:yes gene_type:complete